MEHELIKAFDLTQWAQRRVSQSDLPKLIRRLIFATGKSLTAVGVRSDEGVAAHGVDGVVFAQKADAFVPPGASVWEMGVNEVPQKKANADFKKRSGPKGGIKTQETTFVFVTPRRWPGKDDWISAKKKTKKWRDIRVYDADSLATWLEQAPVVHHWISEELGKDPYEAQSLDSWWNCWANSTSPKIPAALLLSNRDRQCKKVQDLLKPGPKLLALRGDSQDEVIAFFACSIMADEPLKAEANLCRALVVKTPKAWNRLILNEEPLILLPLFEKPDVVKATDKRHQVLVPLGLEAASGSTDRLARLTRQGIEDALLGAQIPKERAAKLANLGHQSFMALRRELAVFRDGLKPEWAKPENATDIVPALLLGGWRDDSGGDREAVEKVAGGKFAEYIRKLTRWVNTSDPPIRNTGNTWRLAARQDSWLLAGRSITKDDVRLFKEIAIEILGSDNPALDLPPEQRYLAAITGKIRRHSGAITEGVAETLVVMATAPNITLVDDLHLEAQAIVHTLLQSANSDSSGRRWCSIASLLPFLSEAAPGIFLEAVEVALVKKQPILLNLFQDQDSTSVLWAQSDHTYLLWTLEGLASLPEFFSRVLVILAKLAELDPGGGPNNRPTDSLISVLFLWHQHSTASLELKFHGIDRLRKNHPTISWGVMMSLIPKRHENNPEDAIRELVTRALQDVGFDGKRWEELLSRYDRIPQASQVQILMRLNSLNNSLLEAQARRSILKSLKQLAHTHRDFRATESANSEELDLLDAQILRFESGSVAEKYEWVFRYDALEKFRSGPDGFDHKAHSEAQIEAITEIYESEKISGIQLWHQLLYDLNPHEVHSIGWSLGKIAISAADEDSVLEGLDSENPATRSLSANFVRGRASSGEGLNTAWIDWVLEKKVASWTRVHVATFLLAMPAFPEVWSYAQNLGADIECHYWKKMGYYGLPAQREPFLIAAASKLSEFGRPYDALALLNIYESKLESGTPLEFVTLQLEKVIRNPQTGGDQTFPYNIGRHLDRLYNAKHDRNRLAILEWQFLPLFQFKQRKPGVLQENLAANPDFFVSVITLVFKARHSEAKVLSTEEQARARIGYQLLDTWRIIPGTREDESIDREVLATWVNKARHLLEQVDRKEIGEQYIGKVLRYGPKPSGDNWPAVEIRDLIEEVASSDLENGLRTEIYNSRGIKARSLTEGGKLEREEALVYLRYADAAMDAWPRTAALLRKVADDLKRDARRCDLEAEITEEQST